MDAEEGLCQRQFIRGQEGGMEGMRELCDLEQMT